ncbi:TetR/AcrR family transcriptional regulator [Tsukamurella sp. 8F]|uniref:TetR/AcrR family transcriptional regulator n=1 Tax=unclassified Tsukamurella TaxID=2633480 RepID=UPI0023B9F9D3|nr:MULTISPECIES: TetR/AcrR family transcriptional regulator [unclassified Tsukamurella]MDF0532320.1 TetR/AcrR family transcriptional regulator [Tsukamurella sp. 8J]MDF0589420.1 TetR/AcrR family transcriptional regulator [Tsukamurella sp. 8F]
MSGSTDSATAPPDGRVTRWDDHKAQRRDAILGAAVEVVAERGADVSVQDIARRASVPRSVVYRVFADRADLDEQLRARILRELSIRLAPSLDPQGTLEEAIASAVDTYVRWIVEYPRLHQFLSIGSRTRRTVGARAVTETKTEIALRVSGLAASVLRAHGADTAVAESLAFGLIGLVDAAVNRWLANTRHEIDADGLATFLQTAIWAVVHGTAAQAGIELVPTMSVVAVMDAH